MNSNSTIRLATDDDVPAVQRLIRAEHASGKGELPTPVIVAGQRYLLVLDAPDGGIAAAELVTIERARGHLSLLAISRPFHGQGIEDRMIGVAEALCEAFGCDSLDVSALQRAA